MNDRDRDRFQQDVSARDVSVRVCPCVHVAVRGTVRAQTVFESLFASGRLLAGLIRSERSSHCPRLAVCAQNCSRDCPIHCSRLAACPHNGSRDRLSHCPRLAFHTCVCPLIGRGTVRVTVRVWPPVRNTVRQSVVGLPESLSASGLPYVHPSVIRSR